MSGYKDPPKEHRFTSENQPSPKAKSVPKWRYWLRKRIMEEFEPMIESLIKEVKEKGNVQAFDKIMDRAFGKVKEQIEASITSKDVKDKLEKVFRDEYKDTTE